MCLIVKRGPIVTENDIKVYKILKSRISDSNWFLNLILPFKYRRLFTPFQGEEIKLGKCYVSNFGIQDFNNNSSNGSKIIEKGLHSYYDITKGATKKVFFIRWLFKNRFSTHNNRMVVVLAYIPKGSKFYIGIDGDIVSDCLVYTNKIVAVTQKQFLKLKPLVEFSEEGVVI
jgi:hypothetical protein